MPKLGFKIDGRPAEDIVHLAQLTENAGFDEFWVCEDLALSGGIAQVATALAVTTGLEVGLGIAPAAVRNAMYLAMELSAVTRMSAGRFHAGIGHGMPGWLTQVGQHPASLMTCLREVAESVEALLNGRQVSYAGEHVHLDAVSLTHPPLVAPPLSLGVRGPKGIELAADLGLGVILAEGSPPEYVAEVRKRLGPAAHITVFVWSNMDPDDGQRASEALAPIVEEALSKPYLIAQLGDWYGTSGAFDAIRRLTVSGDAQTCRAAIDRLADSGADSVVLQPIHRKEEEQIERIGQYMLRRHDSPVLASSS
jgi:alkanesulfonate monooxygenase SsuD/methylene tetrahydromethanopterin reductase-like flavin-dependent oxidoreductase (luciferase family)